jgi:hypothetical protein
MQIRFKATEDQAGYNGFWKEGPELIFIKFTDGQTMDVPEGKAQELLRDFPRNFEAASQAREIGTPPKDRMIRKAKTK